MHAKERKKSELADHEVDMLLCVDPYFFSQDRLGHCRKQSPWNQHLSMTALHYAQNEGERGCD
jgi:hypothetical protein